MNDAGTEDQVGPVTGRPPRATPRRFDTNVLGVILSMKHEVRAMQGQGGGKVINISSTYGARGGGRASAMSAASTPSKASPKSRGARDRQSGVRGKCRAHPVLRTPAC